MKIRPFNTLNNKISNLTLVLNIMVGFFLLQNPALINNQMDFLSYL